MRPHRVRTQVAYTGGRSHHRPFDRVLTRCVSARPASPSCARVLSLAWRVPASRACRCGAAAGDWQLATWCAVSMDGFLASVRAAACASPHARSLLLPAPFAARRPVPQVQQGRRQRGGTMATRRHEAAGARDGRLLARPARARSCAYRPLAAGVAPHPPRAQVHLPQTESPTGRQRRGRARWVVGRGRGRQRDTVRSPPACRRAARRRRPHPPHSD